MPDQPAKESKDRLWSHVDQAAVLRLHQLDHEIEASHNALRKQLEELCTLLASETEAIAERGLNRLHVILEHSAHLTRQSISLIDERHELLRW